MSRVNLPADLVDQFHASSLVVSAANLADLIQALDRRLPGIRRRLVENDGSIRPHLSVFVSGRRVSKVSPAEVALAEDDEIWILHAISGG